MQQSLADFVAAKDKGWLPLAHQGRGPRRSGPYPMEDNPTEADVEDTKTPVLAHASSSQKTFPWPMDCDRMRTGPEMVARSKGRVQWETVSTAPCKAVTPEGRRRRELACRCGEFTGMYGGGIKHNYRLEGRVMTYEALTKDMERVQGAPAPRLAQDLEAVARQPQPVLYRAFGDLRQRLGWTSDPPWYRYTHFAAPFSWEAKPQPMKHSARHIKTAV